MEKAREISQQEFADNLKNCIEAAEKISNGATFNDLDAKFQLTPELDLDHIFPEEYEMVDELRKRVPDLMWYSEKMIVVFLCARRHDLDETQDLIQKYLDKKKELGYRWKCPEVTSDPLVARLMQENAGARWPGCHDKFGRMLNFYFMRNNEAKRDPETRFTALSKWSFFEIEWQMHTEPLYNLRQGLVWVMDFKGFSITKNVDMSPQFRQWSNDVQGVLPNRVRSICIFNAGILIKALTQLAKLVLPSKLSKRIHVIEEKDLHGLIPERNLPSHYGGEQTISFEQGLELVKEAEAILKKHWKKVRKERRAYRKQLEKEAGTADDSDASE